MKRIIKRNKALIIIVSSLLAIFIILYIVGFRIVYSPRLENSWVAVSAIGNWFAALGTIAAVVVALYQTRIGNTKDVHIGFIYEKLRGTVILDLCNTSNMQVCICWVAYDINSERYYDYLDEPLYIPPQSKREYKLPINFFNIKDSEKTKNIEKPLVIVCDISGKKFKAKFNYLKYFAEINEQ